MSRAHPAAQDRAGGPSDLSRCASQPKALIPCAAFTPGPWATGQRYGRSRTEIVNSSGDRAIATVWTHEPTADRNVDQEYAEGVANLRLIASAPKLYEALRDAANALRFHADSITYEGSSATLLARQAAIYEQANAAFAALAKAVSA